MTKQRRLWGNSLSMLINRLTQGISTFVLTAGIARNLGANVLGQYLLAISYYFIFVNLASQGFKTLFTREMAREPEKTPIYLVSGTLIQFFFSIIGYLGLVLVVYLLPYSADTSFICCLIGITIIPYSLANITESIFQAQENMHLIVIFTVPIYVLRLLAMLWEIQMHHGIKYIAAILILSESLILLIEWVLLTRMIKPKWEVKQDFIWHTIKSARTFFAIEGIGIVASKIDVLILSLLGSEVIVGIYGALLQLLQPFVIVASSVSLAAFPRMSKAVSLGKENQRQTTEDVIEVLLCMGFPFFIGLLFCGHDILLLIYKDPVFAQKASILNIFSLTLITFSFSRSFSYLLIANGFEKFNLLESIATTVVGGLTGILLVQQYKLIGAALMSLSMTVTNTSIFTYFVYTRLFKLHLWRVFRRPLIIGGFMVIVFLILQRINLDFLLTLIVATCAYIFIAILIAIDALGGFRSTWEKIYIKRE